MRSFCYKNVPVCVFSTVFVIILLRYCGICVYCVGMYTQHLALAGLTEHQAILYEALLKEGTLRASVLARKTPLKRALTYKVLEQLVDMGLVDKRKQTGDVTVYTPCHPAKIERMIEERERAVQEARRSIDTVLPSLLSAYNLVAGMPGVRFYEGLAGVERVLNESLEAVGEIRTYADLDAIERYARTINTTYVARRTKLGIPKRLLLLDSPLARERLSALPNTVTDTRLIAPHLALKSAMQIYNDAVSYVTFGEERMIGVIIENTAIHDLHAHVFDCLWDLATPTRRDEGPARTPPDPRERYA